jgi:Uma2 family endonuclease
LFYGLPLSVCGLKLIEDEVWDMTHAPSRPHQDVSGAVFNALYDFFKGNDCKVYAAPFDVRLPESDNAEDYAIVTVVQPDISVICDRKKLDDRGCVGAPDLIVEILSPSTAAKDLKIKRALY